MSWLKEFRRVVGSADFGLVVVEHRCVENFIAELRAKYVCKVYFM
jgi:hypothetical protein